MAARSMVQTGIPDPIYDLISVAYHALRGAETYEWYAQDAQKEGDQELADFFRQTQRQCQQTGAGAQQLLSSRLQQGERARPQAAWVPVKAARRWGMRAASPDREADVGSGSRETMGRHACRPFLAMAEPAMISIAGARSTH